MDDGARDDRGDPELLRPYRYFVMADSGSIYFDDEHADGFDLHVRVSP